MCNGVCSNWSEVTPGIPQGSVLGTLLFTIFINDLSLSITSYIQIFADDRKIYNNVQISGILKNDLNNLYSGLKSGYGLLILTNVIFYILV